MSAFWKPGRTARHVNEQRTGLIVTVTEIFSPSPATPPGSMESYLRAQAFQHTDLFSALVAYAHIHYRTNFGKELTQSKDIVYYHGLSLSSLRNRLISSTDYLDLSIISSTLILLFIAIFATDTNAFSTHLCGLRKEVAVYRDRQGSILTPDFIIHINYMEYIGVAMRGPSSPDLARLDLGTGKVSLASNAVPLSVDTPKTQAISVSKPENHDLTQLPAGFCKIAQTGKLSWATIDVLDRFCTWILNSNSIRDSEVRYHYHINRATESASMHNFPFTVKNMEHCLALSQKPLQEGDNRVESCLCIAIILCARITTMLMDDDLRLRRWGTIVHPGFRQRLAAIMECSAPTVDEIDCLLWITVNTFCSVDPLETRYRAMHALLDNTVRSQPWTWSEVEQILRAFIWYKNPNPFWKNSWEEGVRLWRARARTKSERLNT